MKRSLFFVFLLFVPLQGMSKELWENDFYLGFQYRVPDKIALISPLRLWGVGAYVGPVLTIMEYNLTPFNKTDSGGTYEGTEETKGITVKLVGQYGSVFFMYQTLSEKRTGTWNINATEEQSSTVTGQLVTKSAFQGSGFGFHLNAGSSLTFELGFMGYYQRNYRRESFVPDSGSNDISDEVIAQEIANSIDTKSQILFPYFTLTVGYSF